MRIKDLPKDLLPREKAIEFGIETLENHELLAIIIGSGVKGHSALEIALNVLKVYPNLNALLTANYTSLNEIIGLKKASTLKLLAAFEFGKRLTKPINLTQDIIKNASDIYIRYKYLENYKQEVLIILMLNFRKKIIKEKEIYVGTSEYFDIDLKDIVSEIVSSKCFYYVLIHNHPNADCRPSSNDKIATSTIKETLEKFEIKLFDHVIISINQFYSFKQRKITKI